MIDSCVLRLVPCCHFSGGGGSKAWSDSGLLIPHLAQVTPHANVYNHVLLRKSHAFFSCDKFMKPSLLPLGNSFLLTKSSLDPRLATAACNFSEVSALHFWANIVDGLGKTTNPDDHGMQQRFPLSSMWSKGQEFWPQDARCSQTWDTKSGCYGSNNQCLTRPPCMLCERLNLVSRLFWSPKQKRKTLSSVSRLSWNRWFQEFRLQNNHRLQWEFLSKITAPKVDLQCWNKTIVGQHTWISRGWSWAWFCRISVGKQNRVAQGSGNPGPRPRNSDPAWPGGNLKKAKTNDPFCYRWVPLNPNKQQKPKQNLLNQVNFELSMQNSIVEIEMYFLQDFKLFWNLDYISIFGQSGTYL